ncbi:GNAT family N-acetyltransferase [Leptolyngbya sp. NK1-12]|uniref:GNAT family N-acetyltransferase n=1 Tax=Leptolyngbya sp. NK1-12 TaxID=2547451 RepID=A0AA96WRF8_9CYAN|nr:GNAT family N-acetyltransferase [Leptolyngbya sp. NK1-12]
MGDKCAGRQLDPRLDGRSASGQHNYRRCKKNDLFVAENYRKQGVANLLMDAAEQYAQDTGAVRIVLATQITNTAAQTLYESRNYVRDEAFYHYMLRLV